MEAGEPRRVAGVPGRGREGQPEREPRQGGAVLLLLLIAIITNSYYYYYYYYYY